MLLATGTVAEAQINGLYSIIPGGTAVIPTATTNLVWGYVLTNGVQNGVIITNQYGNPGTATNLALNVSEYDYAGLTWSMTGTGAGLTVCTNNLDIYKSFDFGAHFESNPSFTYLATGVGFQTNYTTNASLDIHGVTALAFVVRNAAATTMSNVVININLKASRIQVQPAGIGNGSVPSFVPRTVPGFTNF